MTECEPLRWPEERMRVLAQRMLSRFPTVRRWDDTDDILQEASIRLHRALQDVVPESELHLHRLAALQIRRVLIDLARRYARQSNFAARHDTGFGVSFEERMESREGDTDDDPGQLESWTRFHEVAEELPEPLKEVFDLCWYEGLRPAETVRLLKRPERTVHRHFREAKRWLSRHLRGEIPALEEQ